MVSYDFDATLDDIASEHFSGPFTMRKPSGYLPMVQDQAQPSLEEQIGSLVCYHHKKPFQALCETD
jgi:hypothetical protein